MTADSQTRAEEGMLSLLFSSAIVNMCFVEYQRQLTKGWGDALKIVKLKV